MKIRILSDLHLEFHPDRGEEFIESLDPRDVDVLVLAGDISSINYGLVQSLEQFASKFNQVVFVLGNHDYWGEPRNVIDAAIDEAQQRVPNLHWLNNSSFSYRGQEFVGATLWWKSTPLSQLNEGMLNDFAKIPDFRSWVYKESRRSAEFLTDNVSTDTVVVTHHSPAWFSAPAKYKNSPIGAFFVHDLEDLIVEKQPKLWVHGHIHTPVDKSILESRIVCNPMGYIGVNLVRDFSPGLTLEV